MTRAIVKHAFVHDFGPGAMYLTVTVPAGARCNWHYENRTWYVDPSQVEEFARHDAEYRGIPVTDENLIRLPYTRTLSALSVASLDPDSHARTCGYWYCVTNSCTAETAFRTRAAFDQWLDLRGLQLENELPPHETAGYAGIRGTLRVALHMDRSVFDAIDGVAIVALRNGDYSLAKIVRDADGATEHHLNPNVLDRPIFDHAVCWYLVDSGRATDLPPAVRGRIC